MAPYRFPMLREFVTSNRNELISRCRKMAADRVNAPETDVDPDHGVPLFLQQLIDTLAAEEKTRLRVVAGKDPTPAPSVIGRAAALHGTRMLHSGYTIDQVVHGYGDVCQAITGMAIERKEAITPDEFHTLNRCLDEAIADAVTSYSRTHQTAVNAQAEILHQNLNHFSEEQRRLLDVARQACAAIKSGNVGVHGATGVLLSHALDELQALVDRSVPEIRLNSAKTTISTP